jgi:hypothetical protein
MSAAAARRPSTRPVLVLVPPPQPREFPIRFAPTSGLRALLRRPHNSYGWVGRGTVLLDQHSLRITAKRLTVFGLRRTIEFIHQSEIGGVYREGDAVRIDLLGETNPAHVCFWAADAGAASEIVARLPTHSTVEMEGSARGAPREPGLPFARPPLAWATACALMIAGLIWMGHGSIAPKLPAPAASKVSTAPQLTPMPMPIRMTAAQPEVADLGTMADLEMFTARFDALTLQFAVASEALQRGSLSQEDFADGLEQWLMPQWKSLAAQLATPSGEVSLLRANTDAQLQHVIDSWNQALALYVRGLRDHDYREVLRAFDSIRDAEEYERSAHDSHRRLTPKP